ncbi:MAG: tetratricopeptide repeat protein [Lachnospiraceae bacterium]|nr:tetratricopeptide repeat protein [Lachnospiraceae bacterium]
MDIKKEKGKGIWIAIIAALAVALIVVIVIAVMVNSPAQKYRKQMKLAERYLEELDYDRAVAAYQAAIEIDPKNPEAYEALAELYLDQEDKEAAIEVLKEALDNTESRRLKKLLAEAEETDSGSEASITDEVRGESQPDTSNEELQVNDGEDPDPGADTVTERLTSYEEAETVYDPGPLYEEFLNGGRGVYIADDCYDGGEYFPLGQKMEKGREYTKDELIGLVRGMDDFGDADIAIESERIIDCGLDGISELLLTISVDVYVDNFEVQLLIKDRNDRLELCYIVDSWSRSWTYVSYSGYVRGGGSSGAASGYGWCGYIDRDGIFRIWYECSEEGDFSTVYGYPQLSDLREIEPFSVLIYSFSETGERFICLSTYTEEGRKDAADEIQQAFHEAGIVTYSVSEIDEMIDRRREEIGLTRDIMEYEDGQ